jgi:hypothetical protein
MMLKVLIREQQINKYIHTNLEANNHLASQEILCSL